MNQGKEHQKRRRRSKGLAWHWQQTDAWYYTPPGTKKRVPLFDARGQRIRGQDQKQAAELTLARLKVNGHWKPTAVPTPHLEWLVARVSSHYLQYGERGVTSGTISADHCATAVRCLNDLSGYCGALPVSQLTRPARLHRGEPSGARALPTNLGLSARGRRARAQAQCDADNEATQ